MEPLISIVIPTFRGETHLENCANDILSALENIPFTIIFVDDGSPEATWKKIEQLHRAHPEISGIRLRKNYGQQSATLAGLMAVESPWAVTMDDDLSHDATDIRRLLEIGQKGYDLVYGVASDAGGNSKYRPVFRRLGTRLHDLLFFCLFPKYHGVRVTSFRIMNLSLIRKLRNVPRKFTYVSGLALSTHPRVSWISVSPKKRTATRYSIWALITLFVKLALFYGPLHHLSTNSVKSPLVEIAETVGLRK